MADYISREAMHKANQDEWQGVYGFVDCDIFEDNENMIDRVPSADVRPVVRGKWKKRMEEKETPYYKSFTPIWSCSECGTEYDPSLCMTINFCPNCGCQMNGGRK